MVSRIHSGAILGIDGYLVEVEVNLSPGLPGMSIVGLPDTAVKESSDRVTAALKNIRCEISPRRITVNLAPANIKKEGSAFDLPIALGIMAAGGRIAGDRIAGDRIAGDRIAGDRIDGDRIEPQRLNQVVIVGELSLDGRVKPIRGALSIASMARKNNMEGLMLPKVNAAEAAVVDGLNIYPVETLPEAMEFLNGTLSIEPLRSNAANAFSKTMTYDVDFTDVKGQHHVKRALEVAAAGGHNILLIGPPGSGKSMLAKRLPTIIPSLTLQEAIESTKIHSVLGALKNGSDLLTARPFRAPHHTISDAGLIGGGHIPRPGEVSLAHNGVLFLDELPEFKRNVLEVLRQPLEEGDVSISRAAGSFTYPARFILTAAMNPCPCGYRSDPKRECTCTPPQIRKYVSKISGPLLDRIDIHIEVPALEYKELSSDSIGEPSCNIRERVESVRKVQMDRFKKWENYFNAGMKPKQIKSYCKLGEDSKQIMAMAMDKLGLSARAHDRILKVSRTIADLAGEENIKSEHVAEAIQYRSLDRESWV